MTKEKLILLLHYQNFSSKTKRIEYVAKTFKKSETFLGRCYIWGQHNSNKPLYI